MRKLIPGFIKYLIGLIIIAFMSSCTDEAKPNISMPIKLQTIDEKTDYPNHIPIHIILKVFDESLEINKIEFTINDSTVQLPVNLQNWEAPSTFGSYYWYDNNTFPSGTYTVKAYVHVEQGIVIEDSVNLEIFDFREKYYGDFQFTRIYYDCGENPIDTIMSDGWIREWLPSDSIDFKSNYWSDSPSDRRITINYPGGTITPALYSQYDDSEFDFFTSSPFGGGRNGTGGRFISSDTISISNWSGGNGGCASNISLGIRK